MIVLGGGHLSFMYGLPSAAVMTQPAREENNPRVCVHSTTLELGGATRGLRGVALHVSGSVSTSGR
jgi:hypothetical protein